LSTEIIIVEKFSWRETFWGGQGEREGIKGFLDLKERDWRKRRGKGQEGSKRGKGPGSILLQGHMRDRHS